MKSNIVKLYILLQVTNIALPFSTPSSSVAPWKNFFAIFPSVVNGKKGNLERRAELKRLLSLECRESFGINNKGTRQRIEAIIGELSPLNPTKETALSPLLKREWFL